MKRVFVDTGYWIALLNEEDELHNLAQELAKALQGVQFVTTEMVLTEFLNHFGAKGSRLRQAAVQFVERLRRNRHVIVVRQTARQFDAAFLLYSQRLDKEWSLTDCSSFLVMKEAKLSEALAYDQHFDQGGFIALLRRR